MEIGRKWIARTFGIWFGNFPTEEVSLNQLAHYLGVALDEQARIDQLGQIAHRTHEIQRRIHEALRTRRESWLWIIAFLTVLATVIRAGK